MKDLRIVDILASGWTNEKYKEFGINNITWVPTVDNAFNMLAKGRVDIFIMYNLNAYSLILRKRESKDVLSKEYQKIISISPAFASIPFRLLIRNESQFVKKIDDFNRVIANMKIDGTYQRIKKKYAIIAPNL